MRYVLIPMLSYRRFANLADDEIAITPSEIMKGRHRGRHCTDWRSYGFKDSDDLPPARDASTIDAWLDHPGGGPDVPDECRAELSMLVATSHG
jgi:hypothetical protein